MKQEPTDESKVTKALIGYCSVYGKIDNHKCPQTIQNWYVGPVGKGRSKKDTIIYTDEYYSCTCLCHIPEADRPKKRTRKKAAKKTAAKRKK